MRNSILDKLYRELQKPIEEENQVIYILSRIRKMLEIDKNASFRKLKFYCDWALHAQIDNTDPFSGTVAEIIISGGQNHEANIALGGLVVFDTEFKRFLHEHGLPTTIYDVPANELSFKKLLTEILSDTPLVVKTVKKTKITLKFKDVGKGFIWNFEQEDIGPN